MTWLLLALGVALSFIARLSDGCLRPLHERQDTEEEVVTRDMGTVTESPLRSHRVPCTRQEMNKTRCLHGSCTAAVIVLLARSTFCSCFSGWEGLRCEFKSQYPYIIHSTEAKSESGSVAVSILVAGIVIGMFVCAYCSYCRRDLTKNGYHRGQVQGQRKHNGMGHKPTKLIQTMSTAL